MVHWLRSSGVHSLVSTSRWNWIRASRLTRRARRSLAVSWRARVPVGMERRVSLFSRPSTSRPVSTSTMPSRLRNASVLRRPLARLICAPRLCDTRSVCCSLAASRVPTLRSRLCCFSSLLCPLE